MYKIIFISVIVILCSISCQNSQKPDKEFLDASYIRIDSCDTYTVNKLAQLCKIWGFLKYYHPTVATGKYNWDFELFKIIPLILNTHSKNQEELIISNWIKALGDITVTEKVETINSNAIKMYPDLSWIEDSISLGQISKYLVAIKHAKRNDHNYYVSIEEGGNASFANEDKYSDFAYPDTGYRLLALFRYWNAIQYYYPYKYLIDKSWDNVITEFIPLFINAQNRTDYINVLHKLIACINDTHAMLAYKEMYNQKTNYIPVDISFIDGKAIIINSRSSSCPLKAGDILIQIEGETIEKIVSRRLPYISASNYATKLRNLGLELLITNKNRLHIEYERNGKHISDSIYCSPYNPASRILQDKPLFSYIQDLDYLYLYLGAKEGKIPKDINTKGIIIDLRCYPTGKIKGYKEFNQLYPDSIEFVKYTLPSIKIPGTFVFTKAFTTGNKNENYYKGKKIILVNEFTQSHAEFMAMKYKCAPNTIVIGSTTAGANGNISSLPLPGGIQTFFSGIGIYYPDGSETQRIGIIPDIIIKPTIKDIKEGYDAVLNQAIKLIRND